MFKLFFWRKTKLDRLTEKRISDFKQHITIIKEAGTKIGLKDNDVEMEIELAKRVFIRKFANKYLRTAKRRDEHFEAMIEKAFFTTPEAKD